MNAVLQLLALENKGFFSLTIWSGSGYLTFDGYVTGDRVPSFLCDIVAADCRYFRYQEASEIFFVKLSVGSKVKSLRLLQKQRPI